MANNHCLIIDGHSFPALPLPYELNQTAFRPDFCLGTDDFHTPEELVTKIESELERVRILIEILRRVAEGLEDN